MTRGPLTDQDRRELQMFAERLSGPEEGWHHNEPLSDPQDLDLETGNGQPGIPVKAYLN